MVVDGARFFSLFLEPAAGGHINLTSQYGLDLSGVGLPEEIDSPKNIPMIRECNRRHLVVIGRFHQIFRFQRPIEDAVFGVDVQVNERRFHYYSHSIVPGGFDVMS